MHSIDATRASWRHRGDRHAALKLLRLSTLCLVPTLSSCRALEASRCSAPDVVSTVESIESGGENNPFLAIFEKSGMHFAFTLDAIRTVSSSAQQTVCEAHLTMTVQMMRDGKLAPAMPLGTPNAQESDEARALREKMEQQLSTRESEITYKVERTDSGGDYVTVLPSGADADAQSGRRQEDLQFQQNDRDDAERQREYQDQLQNQRDQEWRERQEQLEQEELQRRNSGD